MKEIYESKKKLFKEFGGNIKDIDNNAHFYYEHELIAVIFRDDNYYTRACDVLETFNTILRKFKLRKY